MKMFLRHLMIRLRATLTDAGAMTALAFAALVSLLLWPYLLQPLDASPAPRIVTVMVLLLVIMLWPMMLGFPGAGRAVGGGMRTGLVSRALPALPIGPRWRVLAESLSTMGIVVVLRVLLLLPLTQFLDPEHPLMEIMRGGDSLIVDSLLGAVMTFPILLVWVPPRSVDRFYAARPLVAAVFVLAFSRLPSPVAAVLACVALSAVALLFVDVEARPVKWRFPFSGWRGPLYRLARHPDAQLRHDLVFGPLRRFWPLFAIVFVLAVGAIVLDRTVELTESRHSWVHGIAFGMSLGLMPTIVMAPLGLDIFKTDLVTSSGGLMGGGFSGAWSVLPVRRESVLRAVYLHAILAGLLIWLFVMGYASLNVALGINSTKIFNMVLPFGMAIPSAAGFMVATAVGDRVKGYVALLTLLLFLPVHLTFLIGVSRLVGGPWSLLLELGVVFVLALAGGGPVLVHLRRPAPSPLHGR